MFLIALLAAAVAFGSLAMASPRPVLGASPVTLASSSDTTRLTANPRPTRAILTEGIDVSHWQGVIDWGKVRAAGKRFAYIKASQDTDFVDARYATNRAQAKAAGLYVGAYHFAEPSGAAGDAVAEADHFVATAAFVKGELLPVLDLENAGGLSSTALVNWTKAFLGRVYETTGVRGVIYVSPNFWKTRLDDTQWFADNGYQILWIAHWTTGSPTVPAADWGGKSWTFWQYTSYGTVPGISGRVDLDRYRGTDFTKVLIK
jgi:lysozyme